MTEAVAASTTGVNELEIVGELAKTQDSPFYSFESFNAKAAWEKAHGIRSLSDDDDSSSEEEMIEKEEELADREWKDDSTELLQRDKFEGTKVMYICHFVKHMMKLWTENPGDDVVDARLAFGGDCCKIDYGNVEKTMTNMLEELRSNKIDNHMVTSLHSWVCSIVNKDYVTATQTYCDITIGKTKWHQDVQVGEARHNKGYNSRKIHRKAGTDFAENLSQNMVDNRGIEAYMLCMKRLQTKSEELRPSAMIERAPNKRARRSSDPTKRK